MLSSSARGAAALPGRRVGDAAASSRKPFASWYSSFEIRRPFASTPLPYSSTATLTIFATRWTGRSCASARPTHCQDEGEHRDGAAELVSEIHCRGNISGFTGSSDADGRERVSARRSPPRPRSSGCASATRGPLVAASSANRCCGAPVQAQLRRAVGRETTSTSRQPMPRARSLPDERLVRRLLRRQPHREVLRRRRLVVDVRELVAGEEAVAACARPCRRTSARRGRSRPRRSRCRRSSRFAAGFCLSRELRDRLPMRHIERFVERHPHAIGRLERRAQLRRPARHRRRSSVAADAASADSLSAASESNNGSLASTSSASSARRAGAGSG